MTQTNPTEGATARPVCALIAGPWPSYAEFRNLPEQQRWALYGTAKANREALEAAGFTMAETYAEFVRRVTEELQL